MAAMVIAATLGSVAAGPASALTESWTLVGVTFADGGTLTGTFTDDYYLGAFDLTSQGGDLIGATYGAGDYTGGAPPTQIDIYEGTYANDLELVFAKPLDAPSGHNAITGFEMFGSYSDPSLDVSRTIVSGYATSAPEPASWALMMLGAGLVGGALRNSRRRAPAVI
jgi:hypothetical protein